MKTTKDWTIYCEKTFNNLRANAHNWGKSKEWDRAITRDFYLGVFDSGNPNFSGLISESALNNKLNKKKTTNDHCYSPQQVGRQVMDQQDIFLENYTKFKNLFFYCTRQIVVTQKENDELSYLTQNDENGFRLLCPTHLKYKQLGIKLYQRPEGKVRWNSAMPVDCNIIEVLPEHTEYEKKFLVV